MTTRRGLLAGAAGALAACTLPIQAHAGATLRPYADDAEMAAALERWRAVVQRAQREMRSKLALSMAPGAAPPAPAPAAAVADKAAAESGITNVQTAGVDEGGIVKRHRDHLVVLRRGRLFTVRIGGDGLAPVAMLDAYAPGSDPGGAWYDELLIAGDTVVVVGYSDARGGTEIGLFDIGADGRLAHRATFHLKSSDYYSSRNYASRLVGNRLVFYAPVPLQPWGPPPMQALPSWRRWSAALPQDFRRILPATRVYRSDDEFDPAEPLALHTVTSIDLGTPEPRVESTAVLGPAGRVFYVSAGSVYVWTAPRRGAEPGSAVFRLPLDGRAPTGLKTAGVPVDPFSFLEADEHLQVLLRAQGRGESMWGAEAGAAGPLALLRVPLAAFGDGRGAAGREHYRRLPGPASGVLQNRFVGDWLLWGANGDRGAWAVRFAAGDDAVALAPGHAVERIEALGGDALLVGNAGASLVMSAVRLGRRDAVLAGRHVEDGQRQSETRSHGFFYRASGERDGLLGLPTARLGVAPGAAVLFVRQRGGRFERLGALEARRGEGRDDGCKASCTDWYGNARPLFVDGRVLALMGYEIVEAETVDGRLAERRRVSFAPGSGSGGRYTPFG